MRFAFLDSWVAGAAEGSGTRMAIRSLAGALDARGHRIHFVPTDFDRPTLLRRIAYNRTLDARIRAWGPDVAVGFDLDGFLLPAARGYPLIVQLKGVAADEARFERGSGRRALSLLGRLEARNVRRADRVVVPSRYSARQAAEMYGLDPERIAVVPECIDPEPWRGLRAAGSEMDGGPVILSVARQYPRKNTRTLLRALPLVADEIPDVRLRVVGGGPELPLLRELVRSLGLEDRARLLGALPSSDEVRREYGAADCFCLPSLQEGFGIVFLEAMAAGLPVVGGRAGSVPEVVEDGRSGLLVDPTDPEALAAALVRVLTDRATADRLAAGGARRTRAFTPERMVDAFLDVVKDVTSDASAKVDR